MYTADIYKEPFWAENSGFMTGRDPLGIQNSSITVYGRLLPGMTNLTLRLRYYGFYCWLLKEYDKLPNEEQKKNLEHQYNFIRRAELTIAFIMLKLDSNQKSIIGSDYSNRNVNQMEVLGYYDISNGADKFKNTIKGSVYWDFPSGALGQYYAGSLLSLDLIEQANKFFHIRPRGLELADAFAKSISLAAQALFLNVLKNGRLTLNEINELEEFSIGRIIKNQEEWYYYNNLLVEDDGEKFKTSDGKLTTSRKDSIGLYLRFLDEKPQGIKFYARQYQIVERNESHNGTSFGWYYYFINEAIHFSIETIFWGMLVELDGKNIPVQQFINHIAKIILEEPKSNLAFDESDTLLSILSTLSSTDLLLELEELKRLTKSPSNSKAAMGNAVELIFQIYVNIEGKLDLISDFEKLNYLGNQKGIITEYIQTLIQDSLDIDFPQYLEKIIKYVINDHIATAYRKMGNGESNLLKFVIEEGCIGHIQTMSPKFTNPRLRTLNNFLVDLGYIDKNGDLTQEGNKFLIQTA